MGGKGTSSLPFLALIASELTKELMSCWFSCCSKNQWTVKFFWPPAHEVKLRVTSCHSLVIDCFVCCLSTCMSYAWNVTVVHLILITLRDTKHLLNSPWLFLLLNKKRTSPTATKSTQTLLCYTVCVALFLLHFLISCPKQTQRPFLGGFFSLWGKRKSQLWHSQGGSRYTSVQHFPPEVCLFPSYTVWLFKINKALLAVSSFFLLMLNVQMYKFLVSFFFLLIFGELSLYGLNSQSVHDVEG